MSTIVIGIAAEADEALDMLVKGQAERPLNFKDLTETIVTGERDAEVFLAFMLATAIIRLAAIEARS